MRMRAIFLEAPITSRFRRRLLQGLAKQPRIEAKSQWFSDDKICVLRVTGIQEKVALGRNEDTWHAQ